MINQDEYTRLPSNICCILDYCLVLKENLKPQIMIRWEGNHMTLGDTVLLYLVMGRRPKM